MKFKNLSANEFEKSFKKRFGEFENCPDDWVEPVDSRYFNYFDNFLYNKKIQEKKTKRKIKRIKIVIIVSGIIVWGLVILAFLKELK